MMRVFGSLGSYYGSIQQQIYTFVDANYILPLRKKKCFVTLFAHTFPARLKNHRKNFLPLSAWTCELNCVYINKKFFPHFFRYVLMLKKQRVEAENLLDLKLKEQKNDLTSQATDALKL